MSDDLQMIQRLLADIDRDYPDFDVRLTVENLDNPGWLAILDARDFGFTPSEWPPTAIEDDAGWLDIHDTDGKLGVAGGPLDLERVLHVVRLALEKCLNRGS